MEKEEKVLSSLFNLEQRRRLLLLKLLIKKENFSSKWGKSYDVKV